MGKLILTRYRDGVLSALHDGKRVILLDWNGKSDAPRRGDIFRARIESVNRGIEAAFADLGGGYKGYLPLEGDKSMKAGAELSVQVDKEAVKTKLPVLTRQLSLPGKYLVLLPEGRGIRWSRKLDPESLPADLSERLAPYAQDSGLIVRTNAADAEPEMIQQEAGRLSELTKQIAVRAEHSLCPSLLLKGEAEYLALLRDLREGEAEEILTDDQEIFREAEEWLKGNQPEDLPKLRLYTDPQMPLAALYSLETALRRATEKKVWLKSGGYLIIEPTEAMTVIDVNTGKNEGRRSAEETILETDLEAAWEVAAQLRLRNISGIIVVDFINLKEEANRAKLTAAFAEAVKADPVHTAVEGLTRLGLMELTREKRSAPLREKISPSAGPDSFSEKSC